MDNEIKALKKQIAAGGGSSADAGSISWKQEILEYQEGNIYNLKYKNISQLDFELNINGIEYHVDDEFTLNTEEGTFEWIEPELELGLDDEIIVQYYIDSNSVAREE